jgi:hypothetical protein
MEAYDNSMDLFKTLNSEDKPTFYVNSYSSSTIGKRNQGENCIQSYQTFPTNNGENVVWGSQRMLSETCPNNVDKNELPIHSLFHNNTKRRIIVNKE